MKATRYLISLRTGFVWTLVTASLCFTSSASAQDGEEAAQEEAKPEAQKTFALEPPSELKVSEKWGDNGTHIKVSFQLSSSDTKAKHSEENPNPVRLYEVMVTTEKGGVYKDASGGKVVPTKKDYKKGSIEFTVTKLERGTPYFVRVSAVGTKDVRSAWVTSEGDGPVTPTREPFQMEKLSLLIIVFIICGAVIYYIQQARSGKELKIRKIAGLEAVDEAVGRATEMGRSCVFVPGIQDISDIQTVAGLTVLSRVAKTAAEYDAKVEVPTSKSLVMTAAREAVQSAYLSAGRPDAYNQDLIHYVTDEQFGYVAYLSGMMVRDKPAACFYMGAFFAESLILAETGNSIGAIQVAGTAMPAQLPFFVASCDYTLIGEEFFAASAYLSEDPDQLGSLKGQDIGKVLVGGLVIFGCIIATLASITGLDFLQGATDFITETILN